MRRQSLAALATVLAVAGTFCARDPQLEKARFVESGDQYVAAKKFSEAIIQYRRAIAIDPKLGSARFKLGRAYVETGDVVSALGEYVRAADLMPTNVEAQLAAGEGLLATGQFPEAKARALAALGQQPKNVAALLLLGNTLAGLKELDGAISTFEQAIDADPQQTQTYIYLGKSELAKGNPAAAEAAFKRAIDMGPTSATAHLGLANFYWATNHPADAEREFKAAYENEPRSPLVSKALATFYLSSNRRTEGEQFLKSYAELSTTADPKIILADLYLNLNRTADAAAVLEPLLKTSDGYAPAKLRLAGIDFVANRRQEAYAALDELLKRDPKNENAQLAKARFLIAENKPKEALAIATAATTANANLIAGHFLRGVALEGTGERDEAMKAYQEVLKQNPSATPAQVKIASLLLSRGDAAGAVEFLGKTVRNQPGPTPARFMYARSLLLLGDMNRAEAEATTLAKSAPDSADVHTLLGDLYSSKRDTARAQQAYTRALELKSDSMDALKGLVRLDLGQRRPDAARARVESRLAAAPNDTGTLLLAARTMSSVGDLKRAETLLTHLLDVDPSNIEAYGDLGVIFKSQGRLDEAKRKYEEASRRNPAVAVTANTMVGIILLLQNKPEEARKQWEQALARNPRAPVAANNLAWHYAETGENLDIALQLAQTAKAQLPKDAMVSDTLGWIYYKKGLAGLAVTALRDGAERAPTNASIQYHLGLAYMKNGDQKGARQSLEQALKLDPKSPQADEAKRALAAMQG
jgi:putative PEP-CTERM system TPR-repeat lipoprotein